MAETAEALTRAPSKILIVKPSSLGDVVHSLPFLSSVRSCFPGASIDWVIARGLEGLLEGHPMIDRLIVIDKDRWRLLSRASETVKELKDLYAVLRARGYDLVVDLQGLLRSGLMTMATGAPVRIGFAEAREGSRFFYTRKVRGGREVHAVDRYLKIASALGCDTKEAEFRFPQAGEVSAAVREIRDRVKDYIVLVPGARWDTKIWPEENFGSLASTLPLPSVVIGGGADRDRAGRIASLSGGKAVSMAGETGLPDLIELMRRAKCVVTNDSGPMHIAAALGVPVVALFGPTSSVKTGPYGGVHRVLMSRLPCAPCFKRKCGNIRCMRDISVEMVLDEVRGLLAS